MQRSKQPNSKQRYRYTGTLSAPFQALWLLWLDTILFIGVWVWCEPTLTDVSGGCAVRIVQELARSCTFNPLKDQESDTLRRLTNPSRFLGVTMRWLMGVGVLGCRSDSEHKRRQELLLRRSVALTANLTSVYQARRVSGSGEALRNGLRLRLENHRTHTAENSIQ